MGSWFEDLDADDPADQPGRIRVTDESVMGEVAAWNGKYGFVTPYIDLEHPKVKQRDGKIFLSLQNLRGTDDLMVGQAVMFHVYEGKSGLGAEECEIVT